MFNNIEDFMGYLKSKENIYLFGAGKRAEKYLYIFQKAELDIDGIIVSKKEGNPPVKNGIKVWSIEELMEAGKNLEEINILVTMAGGIKKWLTDICQMPCFKSVLFIPDKLEVLLSRLELKYTYEERQNNYQLVIDDSKIETDQGLILEKKSGKGIIRVPIYHRMGLLQPLLEQATIDAFEESYGSLHILPTVTETKITKEIAEQEKVEIYVVTSHLDNASVKEIEQKGYLPIQVGAALTDVRKGCITDNTGNNISDKNRNYCECTGLYWIWQNTVGQKYIGLYHYRRRLTINDNSIQYIKENDIDVVVAHPQFEKEKIKDFFKQWLCETDWIMLKQRVLEYDKVYEPYFEKYENGYFYFPCNVALWKREWFDKYCAFAFEIAGKIEEYYNAKGIVREDRYMGYLFEQLSSLFIMRHYKEMKVACTMIEWVS